VVYRNMPGTMEICEASGHTDRGTSTETGRVATGKEERAYNLHLLLNSVLLDRERGRRDGYACDEEKYTVLV
jgi:hypothetical protein